MMKRIERIIHHPVYREHMDKIEELEQDRIFCRHGLEHALDVARILYIMVLEEQLLLDREVVYAAGLLHDIGRLEQYEKQIPHHEAGAQAAERILADCGFDRQEIRGITEAIRAHRVQPEAEVSLKQLLYRADKVSRPCYRCSASEKCYWPQKKRNQTVVY